MNALQSAPLPGHFPLASGRAVALEPRTCGELRIGRGHVEVDGQLFGQGDRLRLWRGDRVEMVNVARDTTALYTWELCAQRPTLRQRVGRALARLWHPQRLQACGPAAWCRA